MVKTYFVTYKLHNGDNDGWAYKIELKTELLDAAKRKYHELLSTYTGKAPYDFVCVSLRDERDNDIMTEFWEAEQVDEEH